MLDQNAVIDFHPEMPNVLLVKQTKQKAQMHNKLIMLKSCLLLFNASKLFLFYYEWCATWHAGPQQVDCCVSIRQDGGWLLYYLLVWWIRDSIRTVFWYVCFLLANSVHFYSIFALDNCCVTTFSSTVDYCVCGCSTNTDAVELTVAHVKISGPHKLKPTSIIAGWLLFRVLVNNLWWWSVVEALSAMSSNEDELVTEKMANKSIFFMQFSHLHSHSHRSSTVRRPIDTIEP